MEAGRASCLRPSYAPKRSPGPGVAPAGGESQPGELPRRGHGPSSLHLDSTYLPLGSLVWAACGKDPGYTPDLLLEHANRHACYTQEAIDLLSLREPLDIKALKRQWLDAREAAEALIHLLPAEEIGCLYLDSAGVPVAPDPASPKFPSLIRHFGSLRGAWPSVAPHSD